MTSALLAPDLKFRGFDNNGNPLAGGLLTTYAAGTNTPLTSYQDTVGTPNANPITLNSRGECNLYLLPNTAYKVLLTDSLGNTIPGWPIDNIVNSQLITLYGGVDTGVVNAYVLNFAAAFTILTDGIVIYWVPANNNTGASTLSVNGLGVKNLVNPDGSALLANQVVAAEPIQVMYYSGNFILLNGTFVPGAFVVGGTLTAQGNAAFGSSGAHAFTVYGVTAAGPVDASADKGTFTGTFTGFTGSVTGTVSWSRMGNTVFMVLPNVSGTSNSTAFTMTGLPAAITPITGCFGNLVQAEDNTVTLDSSNGIEFFAANSAQLSFLNAHNGTGWTGAGTKGTHAVQFISYSLI